MFWTGYVGLIFLIRTQCKMQEQLQIFKRTLPFNQDCSPQISRFRYNNKKVRNVNRFSKKLI